MTPEERARQVVIALTGLPPDEDDSAEVNYLDSATPSMLNTMEAAMDDLLAGHSTPEQFVAALQKDQQKNPHGGFGVCH